jgi:uncharacterized protein YjiS (DUF1127 family)
MVTSGIALSQQRMTALPAALPEARSSLVRRLVAARNDPGKRRIRAWLANLSDERLSGLGLTPQDILILRGTQEQQPHPAFPAPCSKAGHQTGKPVRNAPRAT